MADITDGVGRWYLIHTYSGYEKKVADSIRKTAENRNMTDRVLDVVLPTETVTEIVEGKSQEETTRERLRFPGYCFVKVLVRDVAILDKDGNEVAVEEKMDDETWYLIRNTRGVTGFVGPDGDPIPLSEEEIYKIGIEVHTYELNYAVGDTVSILDGVMEGFTGVVKEIDTENNTVTVMCSAFFGQETPVTLELDQVEPIGSE